MNGNHHEYKVIPFPKARRLVIDAGRLGHRKHIVYALVEVDVTKARRYIREHKARSGETLSFTGFVIACLGRAVDMDKHVQAYRNWRNQLVIFDDVDVLTMFEIEMDGQKIPMPHTIRAANKMTFREIHEEIRATQAEPGSSQWSRLMRWFPSLPTFVRDIAYWAVYKSPRLVKEYGGTVAVTAVGMFGKGCGWGIGIPPRHTLGVTLGGISEKPGLVDGGMEIREYLNMTISFDHDIVDGAPAVRFTQRLKELIESGYGLIDQGLAPAAVAT